MIVNSDFVAGAETLALVLTCALIVYVAAMLIPFLRRRAHHSGDPGSFRWHFVVPCLNEEPVIAQTLDYLRGTFPTAHVWCIDDHSEDATAEIVSKVSARDPMVHLVERRLPVARQGKGAALNAAYASLAAWLPPSLGRECVVVGVVDADGRPASSALEVCAGREMFGTPEVGAVQLEVRIANRDEPEPFPGHGSVRNFLARTLVRLQDIEFRAVIGAQQVMRGRFQCAAMGGNGQFCRLSALDAVVGPDGQGPWRGSLVEDFELGIHLVLAGYRTQFSPDSFVEQEGVHDWGRFVVQRTRWTQGAMQCFHYLPDVWRSTNVGPFTVLNIAYYLFQPWLALAGTIVFPLGAVLIVLDAVASRTALHSFFTSGNWTLIVLYVLIGLSMFAIWGPIYRRCCEPGAGRWQSIGWGLANVVYSYCFYVTSWRALASVVRKENTWAKTRRNVEHAGTGDARAEAVASPGGPAGPLPPTPRDNGTHPGEGANMPQDGIAPSTQHLSRRLLGYDRREVEKLLSEVAALGRVRAAAEREAVAAAEEARARLEDAERRLAGAGVPPCTEADARAGALLREAEEEAMALLDAGERELAAAREEAERLVSAARREADVVVTEALVCVGDLEAVARQLRSSLAEAGWAISPLTPSIPLPSPSDRRNVVIDERGAD